MRVFYAERLRDATNKSIESIDTPGWAKGAAAGGEYRRAGNRFSQVYDVGFRDDNVNAPSKGIRREICEGIGVISKGNVTVSKGSRYACEADKPASFADMAVSEGSRHASLPITVVCEAITLVYEEVGFVYEAIALVCEGVASVCEGMESVCEASVGVCEGDERDDE